MEIKLFGKTLFSANKSKGDLLAVNAISSTKDSKYLPDFHNRIGNSEPLSSFMTWTDADTGAIRAVGPASEGKKKVKVAPKPKKVNTKTPKGVYDLKLLNEESYQLNTNIEYVDKQLVDFKEKLSILNSEEYDMRNGANEISSIIMRLENRKKYTEVKGIFEEYPYTTSSKIAEVVKSHDNLQLGKIAQFVADLPKEAIETMKKYDEGCKKICGKQAVYYIIADKKDFKKSDQRRDPILLAQSPFGHVWQILGAWDKEMMFLQEL